MYEAVTSDFQIDSRGQGVVRPLASFVGTLIVPQTRGNRQGEEVIARAEKTKALLMDDSPVTASHGKIHRVASTYLDVDPRELRVPSSRCTGADPSKLHPQIARFGAGTSGMPAIWVPEASDGVLVIANGVTRATRIAKLPPGKLVRVEIIGRLRRSCRQVPKIGDLLP